MINAGEWLLPAGSRESRWIRKTGAVLPVVVGSAGVEGVADGELRGGGGLGGQSAFGAAVVPNQNRVGGCVHGRKRKFLVKRTKRGRP